MFAKNIIGVYTDKNANVRYITKFFAKFEVSRGAEIANNSKKTEKSVHAVCYPFKFLKESIRWCVIKELSTHLSNYCHYRYIKHFVALKAWNRAYLSCVGFYCKVRFFCEI